MKLSTLWNISKIGIPHYKIGDFYDIFVFTYKHVSPHLKRFQPSSKISSSVLQPSIADDSKLNMPRKNEKAKKR